MQWQSLYDKTRETLAQTSGDGVPRLAAAVAFYAMLSFAPLLIVALAALQFFFGEQAARKELMSAVEPFAGPRTADAIENIIATAAQSEAGGATIFGIAIALIGASGVFYQLKIAMNIIWDVPEKKTDGWRHFLKQRLWAIVFAAIAIVVILATALLTSGLAYLQQTLPEARWANGMLWRLLGLTITIVLYGALFAAVFRYLPDLDVQWRHVWRGAAVTGVLAGLGQYAIGAYAARSVVTSAYGAAGSVVMMLIWIYGTAFIVFFGAELAEVLSRDDRTLARERRTRQKEEDHTPRKPLPE